MPTWNQIQSQLRNPNNPVVFFDVSVGSTVSISREIVEQPNAIPVRHYVLLLGNR